MKALEAIVTPSGVRVVEITHPAQAEAIAWCRRRGLDPYEPVNVNRDATYDVLILGARWTEVADELWKV